MTEAQLQDAVIESMRLQGWKVAHFRPARTAHGYRTAVSADGKGYPDITAVRERLLFAEFKVPPNKPTADQQAWALWLTAAGCECYLWTPADWLEGLIDQVIATPAVAALRLVERIADYGCDTTDVVP